VFFVCGVIVPIVVAFFFIDLMKEGLPLKVPVSIVDLDRSSLSRRIVRNLGSSELINAAHKDDSYSDALARVRNGETFGFFIIPRDFQRDAISGAGTTITFVSDMTVFVPGTLAFKGFKTMAVTSAGGLVQTTLVSAGINEQVAGTLLQPMVVGQQAIGNPWTNYSIYLCNSFLPGALSLMVMLLTCYTLCDEIKKGTSPGWLRRSGGSVVVATVGKLAPQAVVYSIIGIGLQAAMYGFRHFPMNCPAWHMILAMVLLVLASQGLALVFVCAVPNLRLSVSLSSLTGILSFSIAAYSFPVQSMYGAIGIFSYILPTRYYFLIYADQALNGIPLYFSRWYYVALILFPLVGLLGLGRLKKHALAPVYVP
jgi:ABC-2 type transport system permease protein